MKTFRKMSAKEWIKRLERALGDVYQHPKMIAKLNQQHHRIREWDLGAGKPAKPTDGTGFHLLP